MPSAMTNSPSIPSSVVATAFTDADGEAISAIADIAVAYDDDPQGCLERRLGEWSLWLEDEGHSPKCVSALIQRVLDLEGVSGSSAAEVLASLTPEVTLQEATVRLHNAAPLFLNALFHHLDQAIDLQASLLLVAGGSGRERLKQVDKTLSKRNGSTSLDPRALKEIGAGREAAREAAPESSSLGSAARSTGSGGHGVNPEAAKESTPTRPEGSNARSERGGENPVNRDQGSRIDQTQSSTRDQRPATLNQQPLAAGQGGDQGPAPIQPDTIRAIIETSIGQSYTAPLTWERFQSDLLTDSSSVSPHYLSWIARVLESAS